MSIYQLLKQIDADVKDILKTNLEISPTEEVPSDEDRGLTYSRGKVKKGKEITTCVLFMDMRKSTDLSFQHQSKTLAKLYSAFVKAMLKASGEYGGVIRNIIGDRVMLVFPVDQCFARAVHTAFLLNTIGEYIINKRFDKNDIQFGIGIDHGKMLVVKVGQAKTGKERAAYKNLVWMGKPANIASKLTDEANKKVGTHFWSGKPKIIPRVLMTEKVFKGYDMNVDHQFEKGWAREYTLDLPKGELKVFGSDRYFKDDIDKLYGYERRPQIHI